MLLASPLCCALRWDRNEKYQSLNYLMFINLVIIFCSKYDVSQWIVNSLTWKNKEATKFWKSDDILTCCSWGIAAANMLLYNENISLKCVILSSSNLSQVWNHNKIISKLKHNYSPNCSLYISYGDDKENLFNNQGLL